MQVASDAVLVLAHDQRHLRVNFVTHQPVHHVHAGLFQLPGPFYIVRFVEPRAQFNYVGHLLAVPYRLHERADDARVAAGAIQGLFDRQHICVLGGLVQKIDDTAEVFVRMMQQNIPLANGGEEVFPTAQAHRHRRDKRRVPLFRGVVAFVNLHKPCRIQRPVDGVQVALLQVQRPQQRVADLRRAVLLHFQPDGGAAAAVVQLVFDGLQQVGDLLLVNVKLAVARHPKMPAA